MKEKQVEAKTESGRERREGDTKQKRSFIHDLVPIPASSDRLLLFESFFFFFFVGTERERERDKRGWKRGLKYTAHS